MSTDIFDFWADVPGDARVHPADQPVLDRYGTLDAPGHSLNLRCLPAPFGGPLRTARVVLLFLNPGLSPQDLEESDTPAAHTHYRLKREGFALLDGPDEHQAAWKWWSSRTKRFGDWRELRDRVAFLNIVPYHSTDFDDAPLLSALPSSRMSIAWAQSILFPQAERGERVVVCLRSAQTWGLGRGMKHGEGLFAPATGRGGHMLQQDEKLIMRDEVVAAVRSGVTRGPLLL